MRIGFLVTSNGKPVKGCSIIGNLLVPVTQTDDNGESFNVAPFFVSIAEYIVDVNITCPEGTPVHIFEIADEVSTYYKVDVVNGSWTKERLTTRIGGDGYYAVNEGILRKEDLVISDKDPSIPLSSCSTCLYLNKLLRLCYVNGKLTEPISIEQPFITTSRFYWPLFLPPSTNRINRDVSRL